MNEVLAASVIFGGKYLAKRFTNITNIVTQSRSTVYFTTTRSIICVANVLAC